MGCPRGGMDHQSLFFVCQVGREQDKDNLKSKAKVRESTLPRSRACVVQWRTEARYPSLQLSMPDQIALAWNNDIEVIYCYADLLPLHGDKGAGYFDPASQTKNG